MDAFNPDSFLKENPTGQDDPTPDSVTGMFSVRPAKHAELLPSPDPLVPSHRDEPRKSPGEFTQFFEPLSSQAGAPGNSEKVMDGQLLPPLERAPAASSLSGVFTQVTRPPQTPRSTPAPGEFTRLMEAFPATPTEGDQSVRSALPLSHQSKPEDSQPSSKMTSGNGKTADRESFSDFFPTIPKRSGEVPDAPPAAEAARVPSREALTQIFQTPAAASDPNASSLFRQVEPKSKTPLEGNALPFFNPPPGPLSGQSQPRSFTRLFEQLSGEATVDDPQKLSSPLLGPSKPLTQPPPGNAGSGEFTHLMSVLGKAQQPTESVPLQPTRVFASIPVAEGPSEFTRIISSAALREGQAPASPADSANEVATPAKLPVQPFAIPAVPRVAAPAPPVADLPKASVKMPAAPKSKLQEWLPILLVVNGFLVLLVVVLVVFLIRRH